MTSNDANAHASFNIGLNHVSINRLQNNVRRNASLCKGRINLATTRECFVIRDDGVLGNLLQRQCGLVEQRMT